MRPLVRLSQLARQFSTTLAVHGNSMTYPATVKAVGINKQGGVEEIQDLTLPFPQPKPNELLVKVQWAGVNFIDTYLRSGLYPAPFLPFPSSNETAGVIVELPTDEGILQSEDFKKRGFKKGGKVAINALGSLKEYLSIPWDSAIYAVPDNVTTRVAGAALLQGITTLGQVTDAYNVQKGDIVLIHTIAGGVGLLHSQLSKARGATVIGTTSTPEKAELAKAHGADHVILYKSEDVVQRVLELTNGLGVHVIYDGVGKDTFESDFKMIRRKGTIVSFGNASGSVPPVPLFKLTEKNVKLLRPTAGNWVVTLEEKNYYGNELFRLVSTGELKINIYGEYSFTADGVRQAQLDLVGGKTTGKLLIKVADE
ncbi:NAD-P-binding protein [Vararia minispora EC-137]|uniref:NAD-P-binding protein n=1 Tax=Vararia minispora EC-137 TaxID=1314806 RepID=A0ACB8QTK5_9AGAM|nr:NAD-P-binding protein [Vararia minispora EC-137]